MKRLDQKIALNTSKLLYFFIVIISAYPCSAQPRNISEKIIYLNDFIQTSKIISQKLANASPRCKNLSALIDSELKISQSSYKVVLALEKLPTSEDKYLNKIGLSKTKYEQEAQDYLQMALRNMKSLKQLIDQNKCF